MSGNIVELSGQVVFVVFVELPGNNVELPGHVELSGQVVFVVFVELPGNVSEFTGHVELSQVEFVGIQSDVCGIGIIC